MQNSSKRSNLFIARSGYAALLQQELVDRFSVMSARLGDDAVIVDERVALPRYDRTVFARQAVPQALALDATDVAACAAAIVERLEIAARRGNRQQGRWTLHAFAPDDNAAAQRAAKLEKAVLVLVRTHLGRFSARYVAPEELVQAPLESDDFCVQIYAPAMAEHPVIFLSLAAFKTGISPWIGGNQRMRHREGAPSRSARKIEEAFRALGRTPRPGETAVDLGAAPGGWTFALARHGAHVVAVDGADLVLPEKLSERVTHVRENGLRYHPHAPVDWLVCDMIVAPHETLRVLEYWLDKGWMRHFIVNLKLAKLDPYAGIRDALALLESSAWPVRCGRHLFHDRWEITLMGSREPAVMTGRMSTKRAAAAAENAAL